MFKRLFNKKLKNIFKKRIVIENLCLNFNEIKIEFDLIIYKK